MHEPFEAKLWGAPSRDISPIGGFAKRVRLLLDALYRVRLLTDALDGAVRVDNARHCRWWSMMRELNS